MKIFTPSSLKLPLVLLSAIVSFNANGVSEDINISLTKTEAIRISNLDDFYFANNISLAGDRILADDVCIYSTTGGYTLSATSLHPSANGRRQRVHDGAGNYIRYNVFWSADNVTTNYVRVRNDQTRSFTTTNTTQGLCGSTGGTNASIQIRVRNNDFTGVPMGIYQDTLTIFIQAQ